MQRQIKYNELSIVEKSFLIERDAYPILVKINPSFDDYGQTVRDMNKCHKTDPPKLGSLYPMNPIFL